MISPQLYNHTINQLIYPLQSNDNHLTWSCAMRYVKNCYWLSSKPPFLKIKELISISIALVEGGRILRISKITDNCFDAVEFKSSDKAFRFTVIHSNIQIKDVIIPINPLLLYQRMCVAKQSDEELLEYLQLQLVAFPLICLAKR